MEVSGGRPLLKGLRSVLAAWWLASSNTNDGGGGRGTQVDGGGGRGTQVDGGGGRGTQVEATCFINWPWKSRGITSFCLLEESFKSGMHSKGREQGSIF